jgi:phospholipid transport system substrate-binding protein
MSLTKKITACLASAMIFTSVSIADEQSEAYVEKNANHVLATLNQPDLTGEERTAQFNKFMNTFANMDKVARFAVGRYGRQFTKEEFAAYSNAFIEYALAVYEVQLDQFRGEDIEVVGSVDLRPGDSVVKTRILAPEAGKKYNVEWRVRQEKNSEEFKVLDVALNIDGSQIWLAQEQQAQFVAILDRSNGDVNALLDRISQMTEKLKKEKTELQLN